MNTPRRDRRSGRWLAAALVAVVVVVAGVLLLRQPSPSGPRLLNEQTKAREVRPFSAEPDSRFDPLPFEPEKRGK